MFGRFGYLYLTEKKKKKELKGILDDFEKHPGWCVKFVKLGSPAATADELKKKCAAYRTYVADIRRKLKRDKIPLPNMRVYIQQLTPLIEQVKRIQDLPIPGADAPAEALEGYGYYGAASTAAIDEEDSPFEGYGYYGATAAIDEEDSPFEGYGDGPTARIRRKNPFSGYGGGLTAKISEDNPFSGSGGGLTAEISEENPFTRPGHLSGIFANWDQRS
jgi:hypothetical protein